MAISVIVSESAPKKSSSEWARLLGESGVFNQK
jgi:translation initiation factor 2B subunit (eIF-2B alpha/beta/delta family)